MVSHRGMSLLPLVAFCRIGLGCLLAILWSYYAMLSVYVSLFLCEAKFFEVHLSSPICLCLLFCSTIELLGGNGSRTLARRTSRRCFS